MHFFSICEKITAVFGSGFSPDQGGGLLAPKGDISLESILQDCLDELRALVSQKPRIAVVLGSGLGSFAEKLEGPICKVPFQALPGFPTSTVPGHQGQFVFGSLGFVPVVLMQGRVHYYEGYTIEKVVLPIRLLAKFGVHTLLLTNAAGGINENFAPGQFMLVRDHISSLMPSPLRGENDEEQGPRFPDMTQLYSEKIGQALRQSAADAGLALQEGVYLQVPGPQYETPAEIRFYRTMGADAVGMSTACEAIAAHHMGVQVGAVSCITNQAAGMSGKPLSHQEVQEISRLRETEFSALLTGAITRLGTALGKGERND